MNSTKDALELRKETREPHREPERKELQTSVDNLCFCYTALISNRGKSTNFKLQNLDIQVHSCHKQPNEW